MSFAEKLKTLRKERGVTQAELAKAIGKTNRVISYYEGKEREDSLPDGDILKSICEYFDVPMDYFIDNKSRNSKQILVEEIIESTIDENLHWITSDEFDNLIENIDENLVFLIECLEGVFGSIRHTHLKEFEHIDFEKTYISFLNEYDTIFILMASDTDLVLYTGNIHLGFMKSCDKNQSYLYAIDYKNIISIKNKSVNHLLTKLLDIIQGDNMVDEDYLINNIISELRKNK